MCRTVHSLQMHRRCSHPVASFPATTLVLVSVTSGYLLSHECFGASLFHHQLHWLADLEKAHREGELYESPVTDKDPSSVDGNERSMQTYQNGLVETTFGVDE